MTKRPAPSIPSRFSAYILPDAVSNLIPDLIWIKDLDDRYVSVNDAFCSHLGLKRDEIIGRKTVECWSRDQATRYIKKNARAIASGRPLRTRGVSRDHRGISHYYDSVRFPVFDDKGKMIGVGGVARDITALMAAVKRRREVEKRLKEREARLRSYFELPLLGLCVFDRELRWVEVNDKFCAIGGYTREELSRITWKQYAAPEQLEMQEQFCEELFSGKRSSCTYSADCCRKDGTRAEVVVAAHGLRGASGAVRYVAAFLLDVTDRNDAERKFGLLFDSMAEGAALHEVVYDDSGAPVNYRIIEVNKAYERILGLGRGQVLGKLATEAYETEEVPFLKEYSEVAASGKSLTFDTFFEKKNAYFSISISSLRKGMFTTVFTDITQRKLAEEIVKASLREKELLLREINHRVKNNLQIINSLFNLQMLKLKDGAARDILRESLSRVKAIAGVHEKLYKRSSFTRIDVGAYFADLIRSIALSFEADSSRVKIDIRVENGVEFEMDRAVTCGLIMNELVTNAFKYAFPGSRSGTIAVEFARDPAGNMYLRVSDDGVGLPPGFDHLHTDTLGLELVATLSEQLGTLACESSRGTSFTVTFAPEGADHER